MLLQIIRKKPSPLLATGLLRCGGMSSYLRPGAPQIGGNRKETAMDTLLLSRIQFAANISFHILFPTITIALGWLLLWFRLRFNRTGDQAYMDAYFFWVKVFALSFAMGVVSGITMSFQFGTNWPGFMERVGNIAGPLLAYEVLTAFFLEAVFLGIMLFGFRRVSGRVHTLATFLVAFGTTMSAFWILVLNSWMHTPQGYEIRDGVAYATDWLAIVFNPSMPYRLVHVLLASGLTVAFLVAGLSALRWLFGDRGRANMLALRTGLTLGAVLIPLQILAGDLHGLNTLEHQPQKVAAMEGNWETGPRVPLILFAIPDEEARENRFEIGIPGGASLILKHDIDGVVPGLNDFVAEDGTVLHPPVTPLFFAFRIMVGVGFAMLFVAWIGSFMIWRRGDINRPLAFVLVPMALSGWVATLAGWYTTEIGRQPWLVSGVLKTADAVTTVPATSVGITLAAYLLVYAGLIAAYLSVIVALALKAAKTPQQPPSVKDPGIDPDPAMALGMGR
jgi:cytochrome d ubiquinol oxidase subunit I